MLRGSTFAVTCSVLLCACIPSANASPSKGIIVKALPQKDSIERKLIAGILTQLENDNKDIFDKYAYIQEIYIELRVIDSGIEYSVLDSVPVAPTEIFQKTFMNCTTTDRRFNYNDSYTITTNNSIQITDSVSSETSLSASLSVPFLSSNLGAGLNRRDVVSLTKNSQYSYSENKQQTETYEIRIPKESRLEYSRMQTYSSAGAAISGFLAFDIKFAVTLSGLEEHKNFRHRDAVKGFKGFEYRINETDSPEDDKNMSYKTVVQLISPRP
jgi:hypothetical protein